MLSDSFWGVLLYAAATLHLTVLCVTLYLHRFQAHRGVHLRALVSIPMRFWLWLSTAMVTKEWVAVHRKHHAFTDRDGDPHSPHNHGVLAIVFAGVWFYRRAIRDRVILEQYGKGTPDDWLERHLFSKFNLLGVFVLLGLNVFMTGWLVGSLLWILQMVWIPFWGAGVVNGLGHFFGYRNTNNDDYSRNFLPFGILLCGEELHNNHHARPNSPRFSSRWWEVDLGWLYLSVLRWWGLARVTSRAL